MLLIQTDTPILSYVSVFSSLFHHYNISMIFTLLYLTATLLYPLRQTFRLLREGSEPVSQQLWAVYWALFSITQVLKCCLPFLGIKAVEALILLFSVWLYHSEFRGGLYLKKRVTDLLAENEIAKTVLASLREWNAVLNILEVTEEKKRE